MRKLLSAILALSLTSTILLTACAEGNTTKQSDNTSQKTSSEQSEGTEEKAKGNVLFWHTYSDTEDAMLMNTVIPEFSKKYPEINIEAVRMPVEGLKQQLITAISGSAAPDVMRLDIIWTPEFAKMGVLEPFDEKDGFDELKNEVFEGPLTTCKYDDKYYGLPLNTNTKIAIWNKTLLKKAGLSEPPKTIDEFEAAAKIVADNKNVWGYGLGSPECWNFIPLFLSMGGQFTDPEVTKASGYINSEESIKIVEKMTEWYDNGLIGETVFGEEPSPAGGVVAGNYLMVDDGPWFFNLTDGLDNVATSLFPAGKGGSISVVGGENIVNFASSENKDAAWIFTKYMMSDEAQLAMLDADVITAKSNLTSNPKIKDDEVLQLYLKQLEGAAARTVHPNFNKINEDVRLCLEKALRKDKDVKSLMDELAVSMDKALSE